MNKIIASVLLIASIPASAQIALKPDSKEGVRPFSYVTKLGPRDHFNSSGNRLTTIGAVIRQDRANFYRRQGDAGDQSDPVFSNPANREVLQSTLDKGDVSAQARHDILNGQPRVLVFVKGNDITVGILR